MIPEATHLIPEPTAEDLERDAELPPNHVVCPRCNGIGYPLGDETDSTCAECHGEGHILNPLIDEWRTSTSPARLIEMLGGAQDAIIARLREVPTIGRSVLRNAYTDWPEIIRCLWPNPAIEDHTIDQRWLSSTVLDLAKVIRGTVCERCEGTGKPYGADRTYNPPNKCPVCNGAKFKESPRPELMPVLADALLDAGCDNDEVIEHCQSGGPHVSGCWAIEEILKGRGLVG